MIIPRSLRAGRRQADRKRFALNRLPTTVSAQRGRYSGSCSPVFAELIPDAENPIVKPCAIRSSANVSSLRTTRERVSSRSCSAHHSCNGINFVLLGRGAVGSKERNPCHVRLQSALRGLPTCKGWGQASNDAIHQFDNARFRRRWRTKRRRMPSSSHEVVSEKEVEWKPSGFGLFRKTQTVGEKVARFRQIHLHQPNMHHDALEFPSGDIVLLTTLYEGLHATVLQLPAQPKAPAEKDTQTRKVHIG